MVLKKWKRETEEVRDGDVTMEIGLEEQNVKKTQSTFGCGDGRRRLGTRESRQPLDSRKGKETDFALELPEITKPC